MSGWDLTVTSALTPAQEEYLAYAYPASPHINTPDLALDPWNMGGGTIGGGTPTSTGPGSYAGSSQHSPSQRRSSIVAGSDEVRDFHYSAQRWSSDHPTPNEVARYLETLGIKPDKVEDSMGKLWVTVTDPQSRAALERQFGFLGTTGPAAGRYALTPIHVNDWGIPAEQVAYGPEALSNTGREAFEAGEVARISSIGHAASEGAGILSHAGHYLGFVGPVIAGGAALLVTGDWHQASAATLEAIAPGHHEMANPNARVGDRVVGAVNTATNLVGMVPGVGGIVGGTANLVGVPLLQEVLSTLGLSDRQSFTLTAAGEVKADSAMQRALLPVSGVAQFLTQNSSALNAAHISPQAAQALYDCSHQSGKPTVTRIEDGAAFARQLATLLKEKSPAGDEVRRMFAESLKRAHATPEQYSEALAAYAGKLEGAKRSIDAATPAQYALVVQSQADELTHPTNQATFARAPLNGPMPPAILGTGRSTLRGVTPSDSTFTAHPQTKMASTLAASEGTEPLNKAAATGARVIASRLTM